MDRLENIAINTWNATVLPEIQRKAVESLENGKIVFLPQLNFELSQEEKKFLSPEYIDPKSKNVSFDIHTATMKGILGDLNKFLPLKNLMQRYVSFTQTLMHELFPQYRSALQTARTSFRPVEIIGRELSYRKDDTRLHVDAFPANPNQGRRILRIFTNINPAGKARIWRMGEPFRTVAEKFFPRLPKRLPLSASLMQLLKITKGYRTDYDHYMLHLHDGMKADMEYQKTAQQQELNFPSGSTWIVYTDCVSHAAMSGQHLLEQTFHLPISAMQQENKSPLRILEKISGRKLI